jgi:hypothetical protein
MRQCTSGTVHFIPNSCPESITQPRPSGYLRRHEFPFPPRVSARQPSEGINMANDKDDDVPFMQKLLDNHFLLLFLGVASPGILYILWGVLDIMSVPLAK